MAGLAMAVRVVCASKLHEWSDHATRLHVLVRTAFTHLLVAQSMHRSVCTRLTDEKVVVDHRYKVSGDLDVKFDGFGPNPDGRFERFDGVLANLQERPFGIVLTKACKFGQLRDKYFTADKVLPRWPPTPLPKFQGLLRLGSAILGAGVTISRV